MKLLLCKNCGDVFNLVGLHSKKCSCGETEGRNIDDDKAAYCGEYAIPLGLSSSFFERAVKAQAKDFSVNFVAYVCPNESNTFGRLQSSDS